MKSPLLALVTVVDVQPREQKPKETGRASNEVNPEAFGGFPLSPRTPKERDRFLRWGFLVLPLAFCLSTPEHVDNV